MFACMQVDYYFLCEFTGFDNCCLQGAHPIFGDYSTNSLLLIAWWFASLVWFGLLVCFRQRLRSWCRAPCPLDNASHVWVWVRDAPTEVIAPSQSTVVRMIYTIRNFFARPDQDGHEGVAEVVSRSLTADSAKPCCTSGHELRLRRPGAVDEENGGEKCSLCGETCRESWSCREGQCHWDVCIPCFTALSAESQEAAVQETRHFTFDGVRYNIEAGVVSEATSELRSTHGEMHCQHGLSSHEHLELLAHTGHNTIPFSPDSLQEALTAEFVAYFYLYQVRTADGHFLNAA